MPYQGFYINLARSTQRNSSIKNQLNSLDFSHLYQRFNAIEAAFEGNKTTAPMKNGELGCWLSHLTILEQHQDVDHHLHILEDDALLHPMLSAMPTLLDWIDEETDWDIIYTDVYFHPPPSPQTFYQFISACDKFKEHRKIELIPLTSIDVTGTTSYFINKKHIKKVFKLLEGQWAQGKTIDIFIAQLIRNKKLKAFVTAPFITSISPQASDSTIADYGRNTATLDLLRRSLFVDASPQALYQQALEINKGQQVDARVALYAQTIQTVLSTIK